MSALEEYQKRCREETRTKILAALQDAGWVRYQDAKEKTGLAKSTLSKYLKELTDEGITERRQELESGDWPIPVSYRISEKQESSVGAQIGKFHAIGFIENVENAVFHEELDEDSKLRVGMFLTVKEKEREKMQESVAKKTKFFLRTLKLTRALKPKPGQKITIVIEKEG